MVETPKHTNGHTVLAVPVPQLDQVVRSRTAHYDKTFVSTDPRFVHAHITVLAPWVVRPTRADLDRVGEIAAKSGADAGHLVGSGGVCRRSDPPSP